MKTKYILFSIAVLLSVRSNAQVNVDFISENFSDKKAYKEAAKHFDQGRILFKQASEIYNIQLKFFIDDREQRTKAPVQINPGDF